MVICRKTGGIMKSAIIMAMLLITQITSAQTLREKKVKLEMLDRVDGLISKVVEARVALKKEDVVLACDKIDELFKILPDHLMAVGTNMDLFDPKIVKMENESKMFLIDVHMRSNICSRGERGENLDIKETDKKLKKMKSALEKQKKRIKKEDTNYSNSYSYYYEFN